MTIPKFLLCLQILSKLMVADACTSMHLKTRINHYLRSTSRNYLERYGEQQRQDDLMLLRRCIVASLVYFIVCFKLIPFSAARLSTPQAGLTELAFVVGLFGTSFWATKELRSLARFSGYLVRITIVFPIYYMLAKSRKGPIYAASVMLLLVSQLIQLGLS